MIDIPKARALCAEPPTMCGFCHRVFDAPARTLLPEALDEIERLQRLYAAQSAITDRRTDERDALKAEVERLTESIKWHAGALAMFSLGNDQLKAENARFRKALEKEILVIANEPMYWERTASIRAAIAPKGVKP